MDSSSDLRSIVVATNLSDEAKVALRSAGAVRPSGARLQLVHCHEGFPAGGGEGPGVAEEGAGRRPDSGEALSERDYLLSRIDAHVREAGLDPTEVHVTVRDGHPHQEISSVAEEAQADLIILGSHRPRRVLDGLLGSTADRVLRTSNRPCMAVNREITSRPRHILVASDLSTFSDRALDHAVRWGRVWAGEEGEAGGGVRVELLHVFDFARPGYEAGNRYRSLRKQAAGAEEVADPGVSVLPRTISAPLAADGILRAVEDSDPDLAFMGTHGHGFVLRTLLGSVASEVVRTLRHPIVVVPPAPGKEAQLS